MGADVTEKKDGGQAQWSEYPGLLWRGMGMGVAEVIPGVSGGTIALVTGVLERFIEAIHSVDVAALKMLFAVNLKGFFSRIHWRFLFMLFSGQFLGIVLCTRIIPLPSLLREYPEPVTGLFFGLIVSSALLLMRDSGRPGIAGIAAYVAGAAVGICIVSGFRADTPDAPWFIAVTGAVAICAWILPGISGSFVLLILRKYDYIWEAIAFANGEPFFANVLNIILPFAAGAVVGLAFFSRVLSWVMNKWHNHTRMAMTGLLLSSLWAIFPFQNRIFEITASGKEKMVQAHPYIPSFEHLFSPAGMVTVALVITGILLVIVIDRYARRKLGD